MSENITKRIEESYFTKKRKPWYKRRWGIGLIGGGVVVILIGIYFGFRVYYYYHTVVSGELDRIVENRVRSELSVDLLQNQNDPFVGPRQAKATLVVFAEFECPFSFQAQPYLKRLLLKYQGKVRFIWKDFPLTEIHPMAYDASVAAQCAFDQGKFWEFHDALFANQNAFSEEFFRKTAKEVGLSITQFNECVNTKKPQTGISQDVQLGKTLGVIGTPTFFINGELIPLNSYTDFADFEQIASKVFDLILDEGPLKAQ